MLKDEIEREYYAIGHMDRISFDTKKLKNYLNLVYKGLEG
jgi:hypothetical protein